MNTFAYPKKVAMNSPIRIRLIEEMMDFVKAVMDMHGVIRIALIGSLTVEKRNPKDADLVLTISRDIDLKTFSRAARRLQGRAQGFNRWADIFLVDETGEYLGRTCPWKDCRPGARPSCQALHCGRRTFLYDDLQNVKLTDETIKNPEVELWPKIIVRERIPADLLTTLRQFQAEFLPKKKIEFLYPKGSNKNQFISDDWSNPAAEELYQNQWPEEPKIRKQYKSEKLCGGCASFSPFNENWGLCFQKKSRHYLETVFEDFSCLSFHEK